jgi:hypothetical protein
MRAPSILLVAALALAGGCEKKSSPPGTGAAPVVLPPSARAATAGSAGGTDAVHTPLLAFLPPFAAVYTWMDAGALASAEPSGSPRETMLAAVPAACKDAITSVREAAWGAYVEEPSGFVLALYGPTVEAVRACAAGRLGLPERGVRAETPSGRELLICEGPGGALISLDAATHVVATAGRVPATLAAMDGGLSLVDDPVVAPLAELPQGALAIATQYTAGEAQRFARVLSAIGETAEAPSPAALAITIGAGRPSRITAALVMPDDTAATTAEGIVRHGLERLRVDRARVQDWTAMAAAAGRPEARILAELGSLFDSLVVSRAGSAVRLAGQTSLTPTEFSIMLTGTLLPALLSLAR